ncbi:Cyclic nucleotide-binding domain-containing protein [Granulicella rosea]|uniref:histidine kinase n=1 Tax=Granulicella rosea TaxID=474952 RepID=A0A239DU18_9BACT|nr:ATP-binding protein [Granulicella rosea]SNS35233.1 Cyclic nucleotide-binding domain-containing protein [Granulicella rosea]
METQDLFDRLAAHRSLSAAPRAELEWLLAHGEYRRYGEGDLTAAKGSTVGWMHIILSGRLALFVDRGAGPVRMAEWGAGEVTGALPYSRVTTIPGDARAMEPLEVFAIPREHFQALTQACFCVTSSLVHTMLDRTRAFTAGDLQNEKMISLGKLSAGLAHELNNPASAIERSADGLRVRFADFEEATRALAAAALTDRQSAALKAFRTQCVAAARPALEQLDREEAIAAWLAGHGVAADDAAAMAETEVTFASLDRLAEELSGPVLAAALRWAVGAYVLRTLAGGIQESSRRVSRLVNAVKGFTHMDQANIPEWVDLGPALRNTVTVLCSKAQERAVDVTLQLQPGLPRVRAYAGELNQIWGNLLDNALDAVPHGGLVEMLACRQGERVVVRVRDNGHGIPLEIRDKVYDPFFTTRPQGQGVGLGLDIARRLVRHNDGTIEFDSAPGVTEFRVSLPVAEG